MPTLFSVSQLRAEVGGPSDDTRMAGHIRDHQFRQLIERHDEAMESAVIRRLKTGQATLEGGLLTTVATITLTTDANNPLVAKGTVNQMYFPWPIYLTDAAGDVWTYDPHMYVTTQIESPLFTRRRFTIDGNNLFVTPPDTTTLKMGVMTHDDAIQYVAGDLAEQFRQQIVKEARQMLAARINEGERLLRGVSEEGI